MYIHTKLEPLKWNIPFLLYKPQHLLDISTDNTQQKQRKISADLFLKKTVHQMPITVSLHTTQRHLCTHVYVHACSMPCTTQNLVTSVHTICAFYIIIYYGRSRCQQRIWISSCLLAKGVPTNFLSPDTKEQPVNVALVKVIQITYCVCQENPGGL